ncbi:hypothetical protein DFR70_11655 [Nocardia tenerifensis]|uniref:Uncharacterized protein n=1 Tax=Nocardia tenerifensis TaxID=228006 RepID=A0A318JQ28_9NOCA|nr:hypothetical protein [Nocardia tenerifensis]PXX57825.1 hypothetical protein DFR70_11655 [Nocardia tenerifensis]
MRGNTSRAASTLGVALAVCLLAAGCPKNDTVSPPTTNTPGTTESTNPKPVPQTTDRPTPLEPTGGPKPVPHPTIRPTLTEPIDPGIVPPTATPISREPTKDKPGPPIWTSPPPQKTTTTSPLAPPPPS